MKIIVTGAAGFIGSNVANRLHELGHEVKGWDNFSFGYEKNVGLYKFYDEPFKHIFKFDMENADVLIHCATSNLIYAQNHEVETFKNNAIESIKLFQRLKGKIVYLSTASVYNNATVIPTPESYPAHTVNAYDTSKLIAELFLQERGYYTTLRLSNVYGTNQRPENPYCGVIGKMIYSALTHKRIEIIGDGKSTRDYSYVDDVVDAIIKAVELPAQNTEVNIATQAETTIAGVAACIINTLDVQCEVDRIPPRSIDTIQRRCLSVSLAKELLCWSPKVDLEEGIKKTIAWMKKEYSL